MLDRLKSFIEESNSTNSNTDKLAVLKKYSTDAEVCKAFEYTYSIYKQYYVTSQNCKKKKDLIAPKSIYNNLFNLLDDLNDRKITGYTAIQAVNRFVKDNEEYAEIIWSIIDRNLKTRSTVTMINKVIPGLIPTFDVALAEAYNDKTAKKVNFDDGWYVSRKLDGVRCICIVDGNGDAKFYSRAGNEFLTLGKIAEVIKKSGVKNIVLDGEVCILDMKGDEDFQGIIKEIKRKDHTIDMPRLIAFDILTLENFMSGTSRNLLNQRYLALDALLDLNQKVFGNYVSMIYPQRVEDLEDLEEHIQNAAKYNWEGLMLRKDTKYIGKRSSDLLKIKSFKDAEYVVIGTENSISRVIVEGKEIEEEMLKNIIIEHKGCQVQVGSGFSQEQRRLYYKHPDQIIGKTVTVQYFEESQNQDGGYSLRFPVIKAIYEAGRDI